MGGDVSCGRATKDSYGKNGMGEFAINLGGDGNDF